MLKLSSTSSFIDARKFFQDNRVLFILICLLTYLVGYAGDVSVFTERFYVNLLTHAKYPPDEIARIKQFNSEMGWMFDLFEPIALFIKFSVISVCVFAIAYLKDINIPLGDIFRSVIVAELVFIVASVVRIIWLGTQSPHVDLIYYSTFSPLALINLFGDLALQYPFLTLPLRSLSLFQVLYAIALAYLVGKSCKLDLSQSLGITCIAYFFLLTVYIGVFVFIELINMS